jgi:hypothetical protein
LNTNRTTDSAHYRHNLRVEQDASKIIDEKLPRFFGAKATKQQVSMVHGRHPKSLPRDSELWIYNKISAERRSRIKKGHEFWTVINETNLQTVAQEAFVDKDKKRPDPYANFVKPPVKPEPDVHVLKGSIKKQLNSLDTTMDNLDIKVDFVHQNQINYGMTFMIMNYANEVLYVDKNNLLRAKPISAVQPYDRVKFKMVDLVNPSNPSALEFGDNLWIQCLDISDNADNSFAAGTVLTTKLYEPPELTSVQFEENFSTSSSSSAMNKPVVGKKKEEIEQEVINLEKEKEEKMVQLQKEKKEKRERSLRRSQDLSEQLYKLAKRFPTSTKSMMVLDEDKEDVAKALHELIDEEAEFKRSISRDGQDDGISAKHYDSKELVEFNSRKKEQRERLTKEAAQKTTDRRHKDSKTVDNTKVADVCGQVNVTRIVEMRKNDSYLPDSNMTDEKASRYNSKQALNLGKWTIHSAYRPDLRLDSRQGPNKVRHTANSAAALADGNHMQSGFLYSITPIIIQQDQYCLSTSHPDEYHHWPPNSTYIIHNSKHISPDLAADYEKNYTKLSASTSSADSIKIATKLANALSVSVPSAPNAFPPAPKGEEQIINSGNCTSAEGISNGNEENKSGRIDESAAPITTDTSTLSFKPNISTNTLPTVNNDDYACLRKIVLRGPPYDFAVDRKCVWKICLFEQFSENYMQLSTKEKQATKLMENATMALKLSKMNREGARLHMQSNPAEQLPALVGGEKFSKTLREITFKKSLKAQNQYFRDRRIRELKLQEYFQHRINHHIQNLDPDSPVGSRSPSRSAEYNPSSSFLTQDSGGIAMKGYGGLYGASMTSPPTSPTLNTTSSPPMKTHWGSNLDDSSLDSLDEGVFNSRRKSAMSSKVGRRSSLESSDSLGSISLEDSKQLKTHASTPILPSEASINRSNSSDNGSLPYLTPKIDLCDDVKRVFNLKDYRRDKSLFVLNNPDSVKHFQSFSVGEQVLSLHKTMNHLNRVAEVRC